MSHKSSPPSDNAVPLKSDLFGRVYAVERAGQRVVVRDTASAPISLRWFARLLLRREARALAALSDISSVPELLAADGHTLERTFVDGAPMHLAKPRNREYYKKAMAALRRMHTRNVAHNDLAKEPNLLVSDDGDPVFIDFQLASVAPSRGPLFRLLAREDIRHLLKHKRTYCPETLTRRERKILDTPTLPARLVRGVFKPVYLFITRRILGWADREGAGDRGDTRQP